MALTVITKLVNAELIPPLMQSTVKALDNAQVLNRCSHGWPRSVLTRVLNARHAG